MIMDVAPIWWGISSLPIDLKVVTVYNNNNINFVVVYVLRHSVQRVVVTIWIEPKVTVVVPTPSSAVLNALIKHIISVSPIASFS